MAVTVRIPSYLASFAGGRNSLELDGSPATVADALASLWQLHPALRDRILDEQGAVRQHINIFIDGENIRDCGGLGAQARDGAEIVILPAVSGG